MPNTAMQNRQLKRILLSVEKPGRYSGGEFGMAPLKKDAALHVAVSYPDLYEIGMSNLAIQILYSRLNAVKDVYCERVFTPAPDFAAGLTKASLPLFSLETGRPLKDFDLLGFSIGYELIITNVLSMLSLSGIPLSWKDRGESDPLIVAGGPAVINPLPFSRFFDAIYIGEAEDEFPQICADLAQIRRDGGKREDLLRHIRASSHFFHQGKREKTSRKVWECFGKDPDEPETVFPVPNIKTVQDHGVVEIMRGCPNGCRFCQAGYMYRPHREKDAELIIAEVDRLVTRSGYTEITLASLSTGDYSGILDLLKNLNDRYSSRGVSFSLPSLKISSFLLPILREVKVVRKTGLTFAVETPEEQWQLCLNKSTEAEKITDILKHARELGWKGAKFYFMIGLPPSFNEDEENAIVRFMQSLYAQVPMNYTVNVGTFVPKPHTPYQWAPMLDEREAFRRAMYIKKSLSKRFFKVSFHDTFQSFLEAMISRGDERAGDIIEKAFRAGAVLDAWEEHLDKNAWRSAIETADWDVAAETLTGRSFEKPLPWDVIDLHVASGFLAKEREKSLKGELTGACEEPCGHNCGSCRGERSIRQAGRNAEPGTGTGASQPDGDCVKYLFSFKKLDAAVYLSHLNLVRIFERAFIRSGFQPCYSEGFNPQPKIEFAQPLSLGVETHGDMCAVELKGNPGCAELERACNSAMPEGIGITSIRALPANPDGRKPPSLMSLYAGSDYTVQPDGTSSGLSLEKVAEKLEGYFTRKNITNCGVSAGAEFLEVKIRPHSEGRGNILAILREALDTDEPLGLGLSVARTRMWAGTGGKGEADYFSVFNV